MQMYNETRRKTNSVRLFLQQKEINEDGFFRKECIIKKKLSIQDTNLY